MHPLRNETRMAVLREEICILFKKNYKWPEIFAAHGKNILKKFEWILIHWAHIGSLWKKNTLQYLSHESKIIYTGHRYCSLLNQFRTLLYSGSHCILWHSQSLSSKGQLHLVWTYLHSQSRNYQKLKSKTQWENKQKNSTHLSYNLKIGSTLTF